MATCCITLAPSVKVSASAGDAGCVPSTPRDLEGNGFLVTFYYFEATEGQTDFSGADKNGNVFAGSDNSMLFVNGVMLDDDCYQMNNTSFRLTEPCLTNADIVSVAVFRQPESSGEGGTGQVSTLNVMTIPPGEDVARPMNQPASLELVTTQFDANWFLNDRIEEVEDKVDGLQVSTLNVTTVPQGEDVTRPMNRPASLELVTTQFDANWFLNDRIDEVEEKVDGLDIPDEFDPEGLASQEWVLDQSYITEQPLTDAIDKVVQDQLEVDQRQDNEIQLLETRVSQIESVSLDARYMFEGDGSLPRAGEFTILNGNEVAEQWIDANGLAFNEEALEGRPEWDKVTAGDVIRLGGSTSSGIAPAQGREADSFAEFKVTGIVTANSFTVELIRSASHPVPGVEYGVLLLSSFDPAGLASTEFVLEVSGQTLDASKQYTDNTVKDYIPKSGGDVTGKLTFKSGAYVDGSSNSVMNGRSSFNVRVHADRPATLESGSSYKAVLKVLKYEDQDGENSDRSLSPFVLYANGNIDTRQILSKGQIKIENNEFKVAKEDGTNVLRVRPNDNTTFNQPVIINDNLDMKDNRIIGCGPADPNRGHDVVNVDFLNEALGSIDTEVDTDELDSRYVSKEGDSVSSYLNVQSSSSGTSAKPFAVFTRNDFDTPKFHVTGTGSVCAGTTAGEAFMAYYDYDLVTLKKLKEEMEELRSQCTPLLWKYNPDVPANDLGNGEFNLGTNPDWDGTGSTYIYMSKLNARNKKWFGKNDDKAYSHDLGWWGMITITDYDPDIVLQAKTGKMHFNEDSNNYFKMHISYLKKNFSLYANRYYNINLPGFLPQFKYTNAMYSNGQTFSAFDLSDEEKKE